MFSKTYLKLAGFYLLVLAVISFIFSINIYQLSIAAIKNDLALHNARYERLILPTEIKVALLRETNQQYLTSKKNIIARLVAINTFVLVAGGLLSYYLARQTLLPIEKAHKSLERFTADASHELRTPITAMRTETEVTLMNPKLTLKEAKVQLDSNLEEMSKLTKLIETLLNLARFNELDEKKFAQTEASQLLKQAINGVNQQAEAKNIKINLISDKKQNLFVDEAGLKQALTIILENALKYSQSNTVVEVITERTGALFRIIIKDQGVGIKQEDLKHIFDRFYRADSSRTKSGQGGYGLGLSIAKNIVEKNGGTIFAQSEPGKGSAFIIQFNV